MKTFKSVGVFILVAFISGAIDLSAAELIFAVDITTEKSGSAIP